MKTLHRIRYDINIYFANFQDWDIIGFLEMGIFMRVPDQFMWPWPTCLGSDTHPALINVSLFSDAQL